MTTRFNKLHNRHQGERAVIVANGPSLNKMTLDFLRKENVIGLNKIFLGIEKFGFYPRYLVAMNEKVIEQSVTDLKALNCVKFLSHHGADGFIDEDALTYHFNTKNPKQRFYKDISKGLHEGWTVTYAALQIAFYLGFKEIVIIGLDHRFEYDGKKNELKVLDGADPNHFCENYFGFGQEWHHPDLTKSEESFSIARKMYEDNGRKILDATVNGECNVFDKVDYREYFLVDKQ